VGFISGGWAFSGLPCGARGPVIACDCRGGMGKENGGKATEGEKERAGRKSEQRKSGQCEDLQLGKRGGGGRQAGRKEGREGWRKSLRGQGVCVGGTGCVWGEGQGVGGWGEGGAPGPGWTPCSCKGRRTIAPVRVCVCVCVCVCVRVCRCGRACARVCVRAYLCLRVYGTTSVCGAVHR
jgi:hypothetical protein